MKNEVNFNTLVGKVLLEIVGDKNSESLIFRCQDGSEYKMYHEQDCCESVYIEDIDGNISRLLGLPITIAEEASSSGNVGESGDTCTWTFYKLGNVIDTVTIRWYGESNGYYSEDASFYQTKEADRQEVTMTTNLETREKELAREIVELKIKLSEIAGKLSKSEIELGIIQEAVKASEETEAQKAKKIEEKIETFWDGVYESPDNFSVKFVDVSGEKERCIDINISRAYNHPKLTFAVLKKMSELFETDRIDTYDEWSHGGCDTCDYGSSYGYTIRVLPNEKGGKFTFKLD